jgi:hypothetical protein
VGFEAGGAAALAASELAGLKMLNPDRGIHLWTAHTPKPKTATASAIMRNSTARIWNDTLIATASERYRVSQSPGCEC